MSVEIKLTHYRFSRGEVTYITASELETSMIFTERAARRDCPA
jgi:hypothetical protein